ncbi:MAG TPA: ATPase, T2SS/T4P/T4SS family, partial [Labilithrix sp.]|nr:ATPase, T2SS/T4P/T4SS family [Labilithrix sp.]
MFAIIISEKGGAERRESFDKNEINVGRVQGNDLMLPKGNVSKHHARLLFRDGRFIVTDLKSTNGTYVNGRKIAQATIVREGDKIYIGDFVLRLESSAGAGALAPAQESPSGGGGSDETVGREQPVARPPAPAPSPPLVTLKAPTHPPGAPLPRPQPQNVSHAVPPAAPSGPGFGTAPQVPRVVEPPSSPRYGLEHDPDDSAPVQKPRHPSAAPPAAAPVPVPLGAGGRPLTVPLNQISPQIAPSPLIGARAATAPSPGAQPAPVAAAPAAHGGPSFAQQPAPAPPLPPPPMPAPQAAPQPTAPIAQPAAPAPPPFASPLASSLTSAVSRGTAPPPRVPPKETPAQAGRRLALMTLLDRIADAVDLSPLRSSPTAPEPLAQQIERAARDQASAMREEGDAPEGIDLDSIVRDAHRELVGLGAFGPLLDDEEVGEIHCVRFDQIFTRRTGADLVAEPTTFSSEEALYRAIARLAQQSGDPWRPGESVVERRLARAAFVAIAPPAAANHVVSIRKRRRIESTLEELTRGAVLSKGIAQFLEACVSARANILVSGTAPLPILSALAAAGSSTERVAVVQDVEEIGVGNAHVATLTADGSRKLAEDCVRAASKLRADRLVVTQLTGGVAAATIDAMTEGTEGVLAALSAPTLRQGLGRLVGQLVLHRAGLSLEGMREVVGESFEIAIEVGVFPDGRLRVTRVAELAGADPKGIVARDLFVFN